MSDKPSGITGELGGEEQELGKAASVGPSPIPSPRSARGGSPTPPPRTSSKNPAAGVSINYNMPLADFIANLSSRDDEAGKLADAKQYIKKHRNDDGFGFETVKTISSALQHADETPYSNEEALMLGFEAVGKSNIADHNKLATGYIGMLRGTEKIGEVAGLLLTEGVPTEAKKVVAGYLSENRGDDAAEYFALLPESEGRSRGDVNAELAELNADLGKAVIAKQNESIAAPEVGASESQMLERAINYEDGNPQAAKGFIESKPKFKEVRDGIVQIIQERRLQGRDVTYADIEAMISYAPRPRQTIDSFTEGAPAVETTVADVVSVALRELSSDYERRRAEGVASRSLEEISYSPRDFIEGLKLSQEQVLALGSDESISPKFLRDILQTDPANSTENALKIGKARNDLSFQEVRVLAQGLDSAGKSDARIFAELASERLGNDQSAKKLLEGLSLEKVASYSKEGKLDFRATGIMLRFAADATPETLEPHYIDVLSSSIVSGENDTAKFQSYKTCAAIIRDEAYNEENKEQFNMAASAMIKNNHQHIGFVMEQVPQEKQSFRLGIEKINANVSRKSQILFSAGVRLKDISANLPEDVQKYVLLANLAMIYSNAGKSQEFVDQLKELDFGMQKNILGTIPDSGNRNLKRSLAQNILGSNKDIVSGYSLHDFRDLYKLANGDQKDYNKEAVVKYLETRARNKALDAEEAADIAKFLNPGKEKDARADVLKLCDVLGVPAKRGFLEGISLKWNQFRHGKEGYKDKCKQELQQNGYGVGILAPLNVEVKGYGTFSPAVVEEGKADIGSYSHSRSGSDISEGELSALSTPLEVQVETGIAASSLGQVDKVHIKKLEEFSERKRRVQILENQFARAQDSEKETITLQFVRDRDEAECNRIFAIDSPSKKEKEKVCGAFGISMTEENYELAKKVGTKPEYNGYNYGNIDDLIKAKKAYIAEIELSPEIVDARQAIRAAQATIPSRKDVATSVRSGSPVTGRQTPSSPLSTPVSLSGSPVGPTIKKMDGRRASEYWP